MGTKTRTNVYETHYHLVFATKYRKEIFDSEENQTAMKNNLKDISEKQGFLLEKVDVLPDHVHLTLSFSPKYSGSEIVKKIKWTSARLWILNHRETKELL